MELVVTSRVVGKKSYVKAIRQKGGIPAVIYSQGNQGENVVVDGEIFKKFLNSIETGSLSSTIFILKNGKKTIPAIIKDIQYQVTTYEVTHLDFIELHDNVEVKLNVPIRCTNVVDCIGVKLGGVLRQILYAIKVACFPKDIKPFFELDVKNLGLGQTLKLSDLNIPENIIPITSLKEVVVTMGRR